MKDVLIAMLAIAFLAGCSKDQKQFGEPIDLKAKSITVDELVKNHQNYEGKMILVEGWMGDLCSDGQDFYFKGKYELVEVIPPEGQMPPQTLKGKPVKIYGSLWTKKESSEGVHSEKDEAAEGEEEGESEIKIQAKGIQFR
jgi:hypothetical protein